MGLAVRLRLIRAARRRAAAAGVRPLDRAASLRAQSCPATAAAGFTAPSALPRHTAMARTDGGGTEVVVRPLWYTQLCPGCLTERVYYGWIILIVGTMGKIMSSPGQSSCIGPTTDAITKTLEMSESTITLLYLFGTLASALSLPQMGKVLDRVRPRTFITGVTFCLAFACLFLSLIPGIVAALQPSYYAPLLRYPLLLGAFFMLRFFGQGSMMMASQTPINYWYVEQRGSRMGWAGATASLFMMGVIPPLMFHDMEQHSWEHTYRGLALIALAFAPVGWMFIRDTPETFGLLPDGRKPPDQTSSQPQDMQQQQQQQEEEDAPIVEENWTLEEARRTTVFWMTSFSIGQLSLTGTAFVFHFRAAMRDQDIPDSEVDRLYLLISIASVISRVGGGGRILSVSTHQLVCD
jgi:OFA family oxalate/formate antiporter-like MFS transporter